MKKFLIVTISLFYASIANAGIISVPTFSADSSVAHLETFRTTVQNVINGQVQGSATTGSTTNILADSIGELDMGSEVNPRVRDSELLGITTDSTTASNAYVATGLLPATDATLTSDISTGTAYVNGYRVNKAATAHTYTASKDTYVDISQTGLFTFSEVALGAAVPAVAANSARLAKVVTSAVAVTTVTDMANRRIPGLIIPTNYRDGMFISRDSATTISVMPGKCEINNTMISKIAKETLTISTAGNWAGGTSLRAANTYGYVGVDASGNFKMHTTAPAYDNYSLSTIEGQKKYASWSSTTYRILGWFRMNNSSELEDASFGNMKEHGLSNTAFSIDNSTVTYSTAKSTTSTSYVDNGVACNFYSSGRPVKVTYSSPISTDAAGTVSHHTIDIDGVDKVFSTYGSANAGAAQQVTTLNMAHVEYLPSGTHTIKPQWKVDSNTGWAAGGTRSLIVEEL